MQNSKSVTIERLSDDYLNGVSGGVIGLLISPAEARAWALKLLASGLLFVGGAVGVIGCTVASVRQFKEKNTATGSRWTAGALVSAGTTATGAVLLYKLIAGND